MKLLALAAALAPFGALAGTPENIILTDANFDKEVIQDKENAWFVKFYAPWCGHCKAITDTWNEFAAEMDGKMKVGECDVTKNDKSATNGGVKTLPTIKFFPKGEKSFAKAIEFDGARTVEGWTDFAAGKGVGEDTTSKPAEIVKPELRGSGENVILTDDNFDELVMNDEKGIWYVKFYAPWCGHCKAITGVWNDFAKEMKDQINVGEVDVTKNEKSASRFGANMLPTIKLFPAGKKRPSAAIKHEGNRDFATFTEMAEKYMAGVEEVEDTVVVLTDANFDKKVLKDQKNIWFVKFYAPWCGHCKAMAGDWETLATDMKGKAKIGKVDSTVETTITSEFGVTSYPTLKVFPIGHKTSASAAEHYDGGRDLASLKRELENRFAKAEKVAAAVKGENSQVVVLTDKNFDSLVMKDKDNVWAVKFYAPWCGFCKKVAPLWEEFAIDMRDFDEVDVKVGKVDVTDNKTLEERFNIKGFPQFRFFPAGAKFDMKAQKFDGNRNLVSFKAMVRQLASADAGDMHILTDANFDKKVMQDKKPWMVKLYAPWCSHCKSIAPVWESLAAELKGKVSVGKVDVTINNDLALKWDVRILPTIKYFVKGEKTVDNTKTYGSTRSLEAMKAYAENEGVIIETAQEKEEKDGAIPLTDEQFGQMLADNEKPAFVKFFAPWCGHCKAMASDWNKLAADVRDKVNVLKVDATVHTSWAGKFKINSFPTLVYFPKTGKSQDTSIRYEGQRDLSSLKAALDGYQTKAEL